SDLDVFRAVTMEPHTQITPVVAIPAKPLSTAAARTLLPNTVPYEQAVANASRAALLAPAMTLEPELLLAATDDWLHQQYRKPSMPETLEHIAAYAVLAMTQWFLVLGQHYAFSRATTPRLRQW